MFAVIAWLCGFALKVEDTCSRMVKPAKINKNSVRCPLGWCYLRFSLIHINLFACINMKCRADKKQEVDQFLALQSFLKQSYLLKRVSENSKGDFANTKIAAKNANMN